MLFEYFEIMAYFTQYVGSFRGQMRQIYWNLQNLVHTVSDKNVFHWV